MRILIPSALRSWVVVLLGLEWELVLVLRMLMLLLLLLLLGRSYDDDVYR